MTDRVPEGALLNFHKKGDTTSRSGYNYSGCQNSQHLGLTLKTR